MGRLAGTRSAGRTAAVVGGGDGIGRAAAARLAQEGATVAIGDVDAAKASAAAGALGGAAFALELDVADPSANALFVEEIVSRTGRLDVLVVAAGVGGTTPTHEIRLEDWNRVLAVNLTGAFLVVRAALPSMLDQGGGSIVTIGSIAAVVGGAGPGTASYAASKGGLLAFTRAIAVEYAERGIRANCVLPGPVATAFGSPEGVVTRGLDHPTLSGVRPPVGYRAEPEQIAGAVAYLASDDASYVTGTAFAVDGGFTAV